MLEVIGRKHTSEDFFDAYELAAKENFRINVDIIAGLPTDTFESFEKTVVGVSALDPANVTLHTLYVKRAADIHSLNPAAEKANGELAGKMVGFAENYLDEKGYLPYYLYRQKNTVGNHEKCRLHKTVAGVSLQYLYDGRYSDRHRDRSERRIQSRA